MISTPPSCRPFVALIVETARVASVPLSVKVRSVLGDASASFTVNTPFTPVVAKVRLGVAWERVRGALPDNATLPDAARVVIPESAPASVMPPELLSIPPVIVAPPAETVSAPPMVCAVVKLLFWPLYATFVNVPVVLILVPLRLIALVQFKVAPWIVPVAVILVAPLIAPASVIPPVLLSMPPVMFAPSALIVKPPVVTVCAAVKELA